MKLIDEWRQAWRYLSVQASTFFAAVALTWIMLPADQQALILGILGVDGPAWAALTGFVVIVITRLKAQPELHAPDDPD